jgi:hypothetical protein
MTDEERELLIAAVTSAHRDRGAHRAWHDLDAAGRIEAFEETLRTRAIEGAASPNGLTSTARAVIARIRKA